MNLVDRLKDRVAMNERTARLHPELSVRLSADAKANAYRTALADAAEAEEAALARKATRQLIAELSTMVIGKLAGLKPVI